MRVIHTRLTSFILDKTTKFYESILRKMLAEVFSKSDIRCINNNMHNFGMNKKDTMGVYEYYSKYFCGYTGQCISFLRYLKAFDGYIIKMILSMRSGEWCEKDNKK